MVTLHVRRVSITRISRKNQKPSSLLEDAIQNERTANLGGRGSWELYSAHRQQMTDAIGTLARGQGRLCLLGAGNCNDVDLGALATRYQEIHLVDLDVKALAAAVERQPPDVRSRLHRHAPIDLSGMLQSIDGRRRPEARTGTPGFGAPDKLRDGAVDAITGALPSNFDVVVSGCVMSQLGGCMRRAVPDDDGAYHWLLEAVMIVH